MTEIQQTVRKKQIMSKILSRSLPSEFAQPNCSCNSVKTIKNKDKFVCCLIMAYAKLNKKKTYASKSVSITYNSMHSLLKHTTKIRQ